MKKILMLLLVLAVAVSFSSCTKTMGGEVKGDTFVTEGWVTPDIFRVTVAGGIGWAERPGRVLVVAVVFYKSVGIIHFQREKQGYRKAAEQDDLCPAEIAQERGELLHRVVLRICFFAVLLLGTGR